VSVIDEFEAARDDLESLLIEVLGTVAGEEAMPVWHDEFLPPGPVVSSRLAIHDEDDDSYTMVSIRTSSIVARVLASRMLLTPDPGPDDLLDAVGELGNIAGGNVKSLLRHSCRLSLPTAQVTEHRGDDQRPGGVTVRAAVLGQVVELSVDVADDVTGLYWPGSSQAATPEAMEAQP
jgi:chemotaxis protein CheX